jgi:hypothetical protein
MKLNPLSPNYIYQMTFEHKNIKNQNIPKVVESRPVSRQNRNAKVATNISSNDDETVTELSSKFTLQNHLNSSYLHYTR